MPHRPCTRDVPERQVSRRCPLRTSCLSGVNSLATSGRPSAPRLLQPEAGCRPPRTQASDRLPRAWLCTHTARTDGGTAPWLDPCCKAVSTLATCSPRPRSRRRAPPPHFLVFRESGRHLADATPAPGSPSMPPWPRCFRASLEPCVLPVRTRRRPAAVLRPRNPTCGSSRSLMGGFLPRPQPLWQLRAVAPVACALLSFLRLGVTSSLFCCRYWWRRWRTRAPRRPRESADGPSVLCFAHVGPA